MNYKIQAIIFFVMMQICSLVFASTQNVTNNTGESFFAKVMRNVPNHNISNNVMGDKNDINHNDSLPSGLVILEKSNQFVPVVDECSTQKEPNSVNLRTKRYKRSKNPNYSLQNKKQKSKVTVAILYEIIDKLEEKNKKLEQRVKALESSVDQLKYSVESVHRN